MAESTPNLSGISHAKYRQDSVNKRANNSNGVVKKIVLRMAKNRTNDLFSSDGMMKQHKHHSNDSTSDSKEEPKPEHHENNKKQSIKLSHVDVQQLAREIVNLRMNEREEKPTTQQERQEFLDVVHQYTPTFSFTALYLRLGKKHRSHFNTDSISVLRTLAQQTNIDCLTLLENLRNYHIVKPEKSRPFDAQTYTGGYAPYGFKLHFAHYKNIGQDPQCSCPALKEVIDGLKITSSLLEAEIVSNSNVTFMNLGRKKQSKDDLILFKLPERNEKKRKMPGGDNLPIPQSVAKRFKLTHAVGTSKKDPASTKTNSRRVSCTKKEEAHIQPHDYPNTDNFNSDDSDNEDYLDGLIESSDNEQDTNNTNREETHLDIAVKSLLRSHLFTSFAKRIWSFVEHRFLSFSIVVYVFGTALDYLGIRPKKPVVPNGTVIPENDDYPFLHLSYCLTSDKTERREFLRVLTNICLVFDKKKRITDCASKLKELWDRRDEETIGSEIQTFIENRVVSSEDTKIHYMNATFNFCRGLRRGTNIAPKNKKAAEETERKWWLTIQASTFRHFLQFKENSHLKQKLKNLARKVVPNATKKTSTWPSRKKTSKRTKPPTDPNAIGEVLPGIRPVATNLDLPSNFSINNLLKRRAEVLSNNSTTDMRKSVTNATTICPLHSHKNRSKYRNSIPALKSNRELVNRLTLAVPEDLDSSGVQSSLVIDQPDCKYQLHLANLEIYLANSLKKFLHGRINELQKEDDPGQHTLADAETHVIISRKKPDHIDGRRNLLHAIRACSRIFEQSPYLDLFKVDVPLVVNALLDIYKIDPNRSPDAIEFSFGAASSQSGTDSNGCPMPVGMGEADGFLSGHKHEFLVKRMLGNWMVFMTDTSNTMLNQASQPSLPTRGIFAQRMKRFLGIPAELPMCWEFSTLRFQEVSRFFQARNKKHYDVANCLLPGSSYTCGLDMCVIDPVTSRLYLLQLILNYRAAITSYIMPWYKSVIAIHSHILILIGIIKQAIVDRYQNENHPYGIPSPLDVTSFYFHDDLPYETKKIGGKPGKPDIVLECMTLPIGFSRVFSLSPMIHVLQEAREYLDYRRMVELTFAASLLNTTVRFYYVLNHFIGNVRAKTCSFGKHPFHDWLYTTLDIFGTWQGGPFPRFKSAGVGDIRNAFGKENEKSSEILDSIVDILCGLLKWVDELGDQHLATPRDIPIHMVEEKYQKVVHDISVVDENRFGNFGLFRVGLFLTLAIGAGLTKQGKHVRQIFYPAKGMASRNHLNNPRGGNMNERTAQQMTTSPEVIDASQVDEEKEEEDIYSISLDNFDTVMHIVCGQLGFSSEEVYRDFFECALCESKDSRRLGKVDVLIKGVPAYALDRNGNLIHRKPGKFEMWNVVRQRQLQGRADRDTVWQERSDKTPVARGSKQPLLRFSRSDKVTKYLAKQVASGAWVQVERLKRSVVGTYRDGRRINGLPRPRMHYHYHQTLHGYHQKYEKESDVEGMSVLENKGFSVVRFSDERAVSFQSIEACEELIEHVTRKCFPAERKPSEIEVGCEIHLQCKKRTMNVCSYYEPHRDKTFFDWVAFVPLSGYCWTMIAVPKDIFSKSEVDGREELRDSYEYFQDFYQKCLHEASRNEVMEYMQQLMKEAAKDYKLGSTDEIKLLICLCDPGCVLFFNARKFWHGTLTWNGTISRDLLILHPFVPSKRVGNTEASSR